MTNFYGHIIYNRHKCYIDWIGFSIKISQEGGGILLYVYAEYLLLENTIINFIILYVTKKITRTKTSKLRLFIAALIGSIYTLAAFFPSLQFMAKFSIKVSISILMIIIAFNPEKLNLFLSKYLLFMWYPLLLQVQ